jgi:hypothetical protein
MRRSRQRSLKAPVLLSWALLWFGTILVANPDRAAREIGVLLWGCGLLVQYGLGCLWFIGRITPGPTVTQPKPRVQVRAHR